MTLKTDIYENTMTSIFALTFVNILGSGLSIHLSVEALVSPNAGDWMCSTRDQAGLLRLTGTFTDT